MLDASSNRTCDPERWVDEHGDALYRFALIRVGREEAAEDLVQETFLAALRSRKRYRGQSTERTWLIAILKRKTADWLSRRSQERSRRAAAGEDRWVDCLFDERERWKEPPGTWGDRPETALESAEFWQVFSSCLQKLPLRMGVAFHRREIEERSTRELCQELGVSPTNLWVLLHRARLRLWKCLDRNWFERESES